MAEVTAAMVKELREQTGLGMMECKKALDEAGGDMKKAEELLRIKSGAKASKPPRAWPPKARSARSSRRTAGSAPWSR